MRAFTTAESEMWILQIGSDLAVIMLDCLRLNYYFNLVVFHYVSMVYLVRFYQIIDVQNEQD